MDLNLLQTPLTTVGQPRKLSDWILEYRPTSLEP